MFNSLSQEMKTETTQSYLLSQSEWLPCRKEPTAKEGRHVGKWNPDTPLMGPATTEGTHLVTHMDTNLSVV